MSYLSVNNPPSVNVGNHQLDRAAPVAAQVGSVDASKPLGAKPSVLPDYNRTVANGRESTVVSTDALSKLLDMFELLFKAMRDVLSGKKHSPDVLPTMDKPTEVKSQPGDNPALPGKELKAPIDAGKPVISGKDLKNQLDRDKPAEKKPQAESQPAVPGKDTKVPLETDKPVEKKPHRCARTSWSPRSCCPWPRRGWRMCEG